LITTGAVHRLSARPPLLALRLLLSLTLLFFLLSVGRHPRSTLFPYTTLFRSGPNEPEGILEGNDTASAGSNLGDDGAGQPVAHRDRKSTRLNSSHQIISYAVFCLKKKKAPTLRRPQVGSSRGNANGRHTRNVE